jgi:hypothetical protein
MTITPTPSPFAQPQTGAATVLVEHASGLQGVTNG